MSKALKGYIRRCDRKVAQYTDDGILRCDSCGARLDINKVSPYHFCKEISFQSMPVLNFMPFEIKAT